MKKKKIVINESIAEHKYSVHLLYNNSSFKFESKEKAEGFFNKFSCDRELYCGHKILMKGLEGRPAPIIIDTIKNENVQKFIPVKMDVTPVNDSYNLNDNPQHCEGSIKIEEKFPYDFRNKKETVNE